MTSLICQGSRCRFSISPKFRSVFLSSSTTNTNNPNNDTKWWTLRYTYVDGMIDKRTPHRPGHISLAKEFSANGYLIAGGAYNTTPSPTGGLFIFKSTKSVVEDFVKKDPYNEAKLLTSVEIDEYNLVVGDILNKYK